MSLRRVAEAFWELREHVEGDDRVEALGDGMARYLYRGEVLAVLDSQGDRLVLSLEQVARKEWEEVVERLRVILEEGARRHRGLRGLRLGIYVSEDGKECLSERHLCLMPYLEKDGRWYTNDTVVVRPSTGEILGFVYEVLGLEPGTGSPTGRYRVAVSGREAVLYRFRCMGDVYTSILVIPGDGEDYTCFGKEKLMCTRNVDRSVYSFMLDYIEFFCKEQTPGAAEMLIELRLLE